MPLAAAHLARSRGLSGTWPLRNLSIIFPITFEGTYVVGGMTMTRKDASGRYVSKLPRWALTEVFESLIPRYWSNLSFRTEESTAPSAAPTEEPDNSQ